MNFPDAFENALAAVLTFIPLFLLFLVILIVGLILAKLISKGLEKLLEKVGFDRLVERGGVKRVLAKSKLDASDIIAKIVYYTLVLFVLQFAFGVFGPNPVSDLLEGIIAFIPKIIVAIIIVIIAAAIATGVKTLIENTLGGLSYGKVLANIAAIFILFIGITAALNQVEVATTVTTPILIAVLAIIAGVIIVGAGGGLIKPMQARWEGFLNKAEEEAPKIAAEAKSSPSAGDQLKDAARRAAPSSQSPSTRTAPPAPAQPARTATAPAAAPSQNDPTAVLPPHGAPTHPGDVPPPPTRRPDEI